MNNTVYIFCPQMYASMKRLGLQKIANLDRRMMLDL